MSYNESFLNDYDELAAVNAIIATIGESPLTTLEELSDVDAINALRILRKVTKREQARGWSFNLIEKYTLVPTSANKILWLDTYLFVDALEDGLKLVKSGQYVKDIVTNSTTFEKPLDVRIVLQVPFGSLPPQFKEYVTALAAYEFQSETLGDELTSKSTQVMVQDAWKNLQEFEINSNDFSLFDNTYTRQLLRRR